jgi:hypothetical protein
MPDIGYAIPDDDLTATGAVVISDDPQAFN